MLTLVFSFSLIDSDSYKNVFEAAYAGSEIFNNITLGLASAVGLLG
jgi:hypothetical protein